MAYEVVGGNTAALADGRETLYPKYKETEAGTVLAEGVFTGSHSRPNSFDSSKVDITYYVDCGESKVGLNKAGNLGFLIDQAGLVPNESKIRVTYQGMEPIAKGPMQGRAAHNFKLEVDRG